MLVQKVVELEFVALLLAGLVTADPGTTGLREIGPRESDGLVGGAVACARHITSYCHITQETNGCPMNPGFVTDPSGGKFKPSGTVSCGCVSSYTNTLMVKGAYDQGCGFSGTSTTIADS